MHAGPFSHPCQPLISCCRAWLISLVLIQEYILLLQSNRERFIWIWCDNNTIMIYLVVIINMYVSKLNFHDHHLTCGQEGPRGRGSMQCIGIPSHRIILSRLLRRQQDGVKQRTVQERGAAVFVLSQSLAGPGLTACLFRWLVIPLHSGEGQARNKLLPKATFSKNGNLVVMH
jgi:hypothetical protein